MPVRTLSDKFWLWCIPARLVIALVVGFIPADWLPFAGALALIGAGGLLYRAFTFNKQQLGAFKQPVTWNDTRPVHATLWILFAFLAFYKKDIARIIPFVDVLFGIATHCCSK